MASEFSFDIVTDFDQQELTNAFDQVKREIGNRYDFRGTNTEVTLNENDITVIAPDNMKLKAVQDVLFQKLVNRKLSPKILDIQEPEPAAGGMLRQVMKLIKVMSQENAKEVSKLIKENFPKVKGSIQGDAVRVSSKDKDNLQAVISFFQKYEGLKVPVSFTNYR
ncbi:YajQ family cyclic di-GMP-binding protein [Candidatus Peregrinibacteria bacterium]|nr:YajQ family cyclic di-GMP-binding protein [Candidatus Peregrinibacteria bacterium]